MKRLACNVAALVLALASLPAFAESDKPNIKLGQLALHPFYGIAATYDDNIYLVPRNIDNHAVQGGGIRGSWIMTNRLGLGAELPVGEMNKFKADYEVRSDVYKTQPSANNAISQKANGSYDFKGSWLKPRIFDSYINSQDRAFTPNNTAVAGELVARERRWQNTAGASAEYFLGEKFFIGADGSDTVQKYLSKVLSKKLNRSEVVFGFKTGYKLAPKTRLYVAGHRSMTHYNAGVAADHVANSRAWLADAGVEGELTPKLKGQIQGGFVYRQHDHDNAFALRKSVARTWTTMVSLDFKPTQSDTIKLSANRGLVDAITGGNYYTTTGGTLDIAHTLNKVTFGLNGGAQNDKYSEVITAGGLTAQRRDNTYSVGAKLDYKIQEWLIASANYKRLARYSNFSREYNYKDNRSTVELKLAF